MKLVKTTLLVALIGGLGACASHQTEGDFGNSVKKMIAEQTANPDAQHEASSKAMVSVWSVLLRIIEGTYLNARKSTRKYVLVFRNG